MCMEDKALELVAENDKLKSENKEMLLAAMELETNIKQIKLDLLNQLKDKFINSNQSCELILADMINSLELENDR